MADQVKTMADEAEKVAELMLTVAGALDLLGRLLSPYADMAKTMEALRQLKSANPIRTVDIETLIAHTAMYCAAIERFIKG